MSNPNGLRMWCVELSYLKPIARKGPQYHSNIKMNVLAMTAEEAISDARRRGVVEGSTDIWVWSVNDRGPVHLAPIHVISATLLSTIEQ